MLADKKNQDNEEQAGYENYTEIGNLVGEKGGKVTIENSDIEGGTFVEETEQDYSRER